MRNFTTCFSFIKICTNSGTFKEESRPTMRAQLLRKIAWREEKHSRWTVYANYHNKLTGTGSNAAGTVTEMRRSSLCCALGKSSEKWFTHNLSTNWCEYKNSHATLLSSFDYRISLLTTVPELNVDSLISFWSSFISTSASWNKMWNLMFTSMLQ